MKFLILLFVCYYSISWYITISYTEEYLLTLTLTLLYIILNEGSFNENKAQIMEEKKLSYTYLPLLNVEFNGM